MRVRRRRVLENSHSLCHFFDGRSPDPPYAKVEVTVHHHGNKVLAALVLSIAVTGCSSAHETISAASGVYDLSIVTEQDACSPTRMTGPMGTAGVVTHGTDLTIAVPDLTSSAPLVVALNSGSGYSDARTEMLAPCTAATLARRYTVVSTSPTDVDVAYHEAWTGMTTCGAAMRSIMPAAPASDCNADLVLHYRLDTACEAPCQIRVSADGATACHC